MSTLANTSNSDAFALPRNRRSNRARNKQNRTQQQIAGVADIAICSDFKTVREFASEYRVELTGQTRRDWLMLRMGDKPYVHLIVLLI